MMSAPARSHAWPLDSKAVRSADTAARANRHGIGDHRGSGLGHLRDLPHRSAHRNRMLDNLFRVRLEIVTSGAVVIDAPAERAGACRPALSSTLAIEIHWRSPPDSLAARPRLRRVRLEIFDHGLQRRAGARLA
jgi:hypothetical protein